MPLSPWYSDTAIAQINQYLGEIEDPFVAIAAKEEIRKEVFKLAADPPTELGPQGGPWETRHIHDFILDSDRRRKARITYQVASKRGRLEVLLQFPTSF